MKISGIAYLPEEGEDPLSWDMPDSAIPLRVAFDPRRTIGVASLTRHEDGSITCEAEVLEQENILPHVPKLAVGIFGPGGRNPNHTVFSVSVVEENSNRDVPPYKVEE